MRATEYRCRERTNYFLSLEKTNDYAVFKEDKGVLRIQKSTLYRVIIRERCTDGCR